MRRMFILEICEYDGRFPDFTLSLVIVGSWAVFQVLPRSVEILIKRFPL